MEATIAKILNIEADEKGNFPFRINDSQNDDLFLVHYDEKTIASTPLDSPVRSLRGTIVSLKQEKIVCSSHGYTPVIVTDALTSLKPEPVDIDGKTHPRSDTGIFSKLYEGSNVRVWLHDDELMISTHKKIDARKAYWGNKKSIGDLFESCLDEEFKTTLTNTLKKDLVCYFILMDKDVVQSTSFPIGVGSRNTIAVFTGFLTRNGTMATPEEVPCLGLPKASLFNYWEHPIHFLFDGNFFDTTEKDGYFWIRCVEGRVSITKVLLAPYKRKLDLVNNEANFLKRSYELLSECRFPKDGNDDFLEKYPIMSIVSKDNIDTEMSTSILKEEDFNNPKDKFALYRRYQLLMMHYADVVTPSRRKEILQYMYSVPEQREKLIKKIVSNKDVILQDLVEFPPNKNNTYVMDYLKVLIKSAKGDAYVRNKYISDRVRNMTGDFLFTLAKIVLGVN
jgi:hypothetical protein